MPNGIPDKGKILNQLSVFWFDKLKHIVPNHFITANELEYPIGESGWQPWMKGRSMLVQKAEVLPVECIARGFVAGSGWKSYQKSGTVCGIQLPSGLKQCGKLPEPIFTPSTKAEEGHDVNIPFEEMVRLVGYETAAELRALTLRLYTEAAEYAATKGVIIADTKFEFGKLPNGQIILIDEVLTPDSSRFWPASEYEPGHDQPSFDKQYVRNYLEAQPWDKKPPAPKLPEEVVIGTRQRYIEAYKMLTGQLPVLS
jgi:phosphoribosylaminoimidazole-succinocarboxamide synthase